MAEEISKVEANMEFEELSKPLQKILKIINNMGLGEMPDDFIMLRRFIIVYHRAELKNPVCGYQTLKQLFMIAYKIGLVTGTLWGHSEKETNKVYAQIIDELSEILKK